MFQTRISLAIQYLANRGYNRAYWLHDSDIKGAWFGSVGSRASLMADGADQIMFRDAHAPVAECEQFTKDINNMVRNASAFK